MKKLIKDIIEINSSCCFNNESYYCGLMEGAVGQILALSCFYSIENSEKYKKQIDLLLCRLPVYNLNDFSLGYGRTGIAWLFRELQKNGLIGQDDKRIYDIDIALSGQYNTILSNGNLDYFTGAGGMLHYFVESKHVNCEKSIELFIDLFQQQYRASLFGLKSFADGNNVIYATNLGVPHGLTGIILLLLSIKEKLAIDYKCLIDKLLQRLSRNIMPPGSPYHLPCFEGWQHASTLAWCYGDLPLLYALTKYSAIYKDDRYSKLKKELLQTIVKRRDHFEGNLSLCHGTVIIAYFFYKLLKRYERTDEIENAYFFWKEYSQRICQRKMEEYLAGNKENNYLKNPSLFMGYPGFLLAMMTMENMIPDNWDNCLLL